MNGSIGDALKVITGLEHHLKTPPDIEVVVAPPFTALYSTSIAIQELSFQLGAQNCHWEDKGAYTGEVSASFLRDLNCTYVIVGHSERRANFDESSEAVCKKANAVLQNEMTPVICVGETFEDRKAGRTWQVLEDQLRRSLSDIHIREAEHCVIAYEPVWAIGSGTPASAGQAVEAHQFIRNFLTKRFDGPIAAQMRIIYGGSVKANNINDYAGAADIDGCLVGGASLDADEFSEIIRVIERPSTGTEERV